MKTKLSPVEIICLEMQINPYRSQRYYARKRYEYENGKLDPSSGANGSSFFNRSSWYRNEYWQDYAESELYFYCKSIKMTRPSRSRMYLTKAGWSIANNAREKLNMEIMDFEMPLFPCPKV